MDGIVFMSMTPVKNPHAPATRQDATNIFITLQELILDTAARQKFRLQT